MNTTTCPHCGHVMEYTPESTAPYYCPECNAVFTKKDLQYECIRQKMQMILVGTTEQKPRQCNAPVSDEEDELLGYSPEEYPLISSAYLDIDDNVLFNVVGMDEPVSFDDLDYEEVKSIYNSML